MKKIVHLVLLAATLLSIPAQADNNAQILIDKIVATYGGEERWRATVGIREKGTAYSSILRAPGATDRSYQYPSKMSIEIRYGDNDVELRQLEGDHAWEQGRPVPGDYARGSQLQAYRLALPLLLLEFRDKIKHLGQRYDSVSRHTHEGLLAEPAQGLKIMMDVDVVTNRIMGAWATMETKGNTTEYATLYDDFRLIDGRLIPFKESDHTNGAFTGSTVLQRVEFVSDFPANTFRPVKAE